VRTVQRGPWLGFAGQLAVLAALDAGVGLGRAGWFAGVCCGLLTTGLLGLGLARRGAGALGPADRVTLVRGTLVGGVAAMTADSITGTVAPELVWNLVGITAVALALDWVDGQVARRTRTASELGARFDMEVDALLILVLSAYVADSVGPWVLLIGAARYLRLLACVPLAWMRAEAPPRHWGKVVAAIQGIVLTVVAADVLPAQASAAVLAGALGLLAESFGREVWWLWRHRHRLEATRAVPASPERVTASQDAGGFAA